MKSNAAISTEITGSEPEGPIIDASERSSIDTSPGRAGTALPSGYSLIKELGSGSVGSVFHCSHPIDGEVAVKVLFPESAADDRTVERFRREFGAYLEIQHPNVVRGKRLIDDRERGLLALVMELISGGDLRSRLGPDKPLSLFEALGLMVQLCDGLGAIHKHGIIHRDLKPENLLIDPCGRLKITDFGIALLPGTTRLTEHGGMVGTLQYASPEYLMSSTLHPPGDIYAFGLIAYEMVTGHAPFEGGEFLESIARRMKTAPPPPSTKNSDIPPWLDNLILKALARDPRDRHHTIDETRNELASGILDERIPIDIRQPCEVKANSNEGAIAEPSISVSPSANLSGSSPPSRHQTASPLRTKTAPSRVSRSKRTGASGAKRPPPPQRTAPTPTNPERLPLATIRASHSRRPRVQSSEIKDGHSRSSVETQKRGLRPLSETLSGADPVASATSLLHPMPERRSHGRFGTIRNEMPPSSTRSEGVPQPSALSPIVRFVLTTAIGAGVGIQLLKLALG